MWEAIAPPGDPLAPSPAQVAEEVEAVRTATYASLFVRRAPETFLFQTGIFLVGLFPVALGRMLIGVALLKLSVFSGERPARFYRRLAAAGYGVGLPLVGFAADWQVRHGFGFATLFGGGRRANDFGILFVALGHVATLILPQKAGVAVWLTARLAAVWRMALTNYLAQSLVCTTLFYGDGFGLYGAFDRVQLLGIVAAIWAAQLVASPLWLAHFRFGPAEWAWRSLTKGAY